MSFAPEVPTTHVPPTRVDTDTWIVHQVQHALGAPLSVYFNSMVIAGSEPVIIDAGSINNRNLPVPPAPDQTAFEEILTTAVNAAV